MPGVSKSQVKEARQVDLLSYLQANEPHNLREVGNEFCLVDHDSLRISNGKWNWHSRGFGGTTALDFLIKVRGVGFVDAVQTLCRGRAEERFPSPAPSVPPPPRKPGALRLPQPAANNDRVTAYLQSRGISRTVIDRCIREGALYEGMPYHNAVFVGRDREGTARFGCLRGTLGNFKQDLPGSDKRFGFHLPTVVPEGNTHLAVFESPIDALSHLELTSEDCHRLPLAGTAPLALLHFLQQHPEIDSIALCLDNDVPGHAGMAAIEAQQWDNPRFASITVTREPPPGGKDYNEALQKMCRAEREQSAPDCCVDSGSVR